MLAIRFLACTVLFNILLQPLHADEQAAPCQHAADYVIIGAGTAGALLAKELSDDHSQSVIVLHAGANFQGAPLVKHSIGALITVPEILLGPSIPPHFSRWNLPGDVGMQLEQYAYSTINAMPPLYEKGLTVPQIAANGRRLQWSFAMPQGGRSAVDSGLWFRGSSQLYSRWEAIAGPEWSQERCVDTLRQFEKYCGDTGSALTRGLQGPIAIRQTSPYNIASEKFSTAIQKGIGVPELLDYNAPESILGTCTKMQWACHGPSGRYRVSSATAFLNESVLQPNGLGANGRQLQILFGTYGLKTVWQGNTAIGVEYFRNGEFNVAYAKKGVIVCAGLLSSTFLLHSGIGPAEQLKCLGIPVVYDNPNVGQNLINPPQIALFFNSKPEDTPLDYQGLFSQMAWLPAPGDFSLQRKLRWSTLTLIPGLTIALLDLCQVKSRGQITLASGDPLKAPLIDSGIFANADDFDLFVEAFKTFVPKILQALQESDPRYSLLYPQPAILSDDALLKDFIHEHVASSQCFQGHCRMAPLQQGGVVDSYGRVYGANRLFIADSSIVPEHCDGSELALALLIASNIARFLKNSN